jgi:hypothetical protein
MKRRGPLGGFLTVLKNELDQLSSVFTGKISIAATGQSL